MNLNQVTVGCTDIERSTAFYRRLGLKPVVLSAHYARFACPDGQSTFSIHQVEAVTPGETHILFECEALDAEVARLKGEGVLFDGETTDEPWLWRQARLRDPDGNRLCLYHAGENRLNPHWRVSDSDAASSR